MKLWINYRAKNPSGNPIIASVATGLLVLGCFSTLSAQSATSGFRSTDTVRYQPPVETTTVESFESGNWHHIYIDSAQIRFQNAVSDTTISIADLEKYLDAHAPEESARLAIHLSTSDYNSEMETVRLIANRWKTFSLHLVTPYPDKK